MLEEIFTDEKVMAADVSEPRSIDYTHKTLAMASEEKFQRNSR